MPDTGRYHGSDPATSPLTVPDRPTPSFDTTTEQTRSRTAQEPLPTTVKDSLAAQLAQAVLRTPGVVRLEPTLKDAVRRLSRSAAAGPGTSDPRRLATGTVDGVRVSVQEGLASVVIDITISGATSALHTARAVQAAALHTLQTTRTPVRTVSVTVLSIEQTDLQPLITTG
jgi:hypothetical protein